MPVAASAFLSPEAHLRPLWLWQPRRAAGQCERWACPLRSRLTVPALAEARGSLAWWLGARPVLLPPTRCVLSQALHPGCLRSSRGGRTAAPPKVTVRRADICQVLGQRQCRLPDECAGSSCALPCALRPSSASRHWPSLAEGPADTWGLCYSGRWGDRSWGTIRFSQSEAQRRHFLR